MCVCVVRVASHLPVNILDGKQVWENIPVTMETSRENSKTEETRASEPCVRKKESADDDAAVAVGLHTNMDGISHKVVKTIAGYLALCALVGIL